MKVAFFTGFTTWKPHYETELELIQGHLSVGDGVIQYFCESDVLACDANMYRSASRCHTCIARRARGVEAIHGHVAQQRYVRLRREDRQAIADLDHLTINTIDELKAVTSGNFDLGYAVLSSLVSHLREPRPDVVLHRALLRDLMRSAIAVHRSVMNILEEERIDRFYVFNGRFAILRAVLRACQAKGVECIAHERGADLSRFATYRNTVPHDLGHRQREILRIWDEEPDVEFKTGLATKFYTDRTQGRIQSWYSHIGDQLSGELPDGFDPTIRNVVIFNSSEDEFAAIDKSHGMNLYHDQEDAIRQIASFMEGVGSGIKLYLRSHPNLRKVDNSQTRFLSGFSSPGITIIPSGSSVSTYALMQAADLVVTFGSTMGVEATFWGKPSIVIGTAFYGGLGAAHEPRSREEVLALICDGVEPKPKEGALKYGYYMSSFGRKYQHYEPEGVVSGSFKNAVLDLDPMHGVEGRLSRSLHWRLLGLKKAFREKRGRFALLGTRGLWEQARTRPDVSSSAYGSGGPD